MDQWNSAQFKEAILMQARNSKLLLPSEYPSQIHLNAYWAKIISKMHSQTLASGNEVARSLKTNIEITQLLINNRQKVGKINFVHHQVVLNHNAEQCEKHIGDIHTHPHNLPFSSIDLSNLVIKPAHLISVVIQPNRKVLLAIRTKLTERLTTDRDKFINECEHRYPFPYMEHDKMLIANLLFARDFNLAFYSGYFDLSNGAKLVLKKKTIRKKKNILDNILDTFFKK